MLFKNILLQQEHGPGFFLLTMLLYPIDPQNKVLNLAHSCKNYCERENPRGGRDGGGAYILGLMERVVWCQFVLIGKIYGVH